MHVFIAIPSDGHVHAWFAQSLAALIARTMAEGVPAGAKRVQPRLTTRFEIGKLPMVRNRLLKLAIESSADCTLWLDSDHIFPDWALLRLLLAERDVVGINQPSRSRPHFPTARGVDLKRLYGTEKDAKAGLVEQVSQIGFPMVLMRMSIIERLARQAAAEGRDGIFPMFDFTMTGDPDVSIGEDTFFCRRCAEAGIDIYLDHQLSWATWHIAEMPVGLREALADRDAAEAAGKG